MRKEYDLEKLRVKRRGPLPGFEASQPPPKVRITISLDQDVVEHFKAEAAKPGGLPYQTQINQALRRVLESDESSPSAETLKSLLLEDGDFLERLAAKLRAA